jgi:DNA polymerase I-like protein with 3'-5' exonuclease and polymerase domains
MDIITIDFETYYDKQVSLGKLTTEEYIRSPDFEVIGVAVKVNDEETIWLSGTLDILKAYLHKHYSWERSALLAHNTMFDGAILNWLFGIRPKLLLDTLCMSRALHGTEVSSALGQLAEQYNIGVKGDEVLNALGKHRSDFTTEQLAAYGDYCVQDVELTYKLFTIFMQQRAFPKAELKTIDLTLRMFVEPILQLNAYKLEGHLATLKVQKERLLQDGGIQKEELMSNPKFALALERLGVNVPTKTSLRTGKETFAFAKSDEGFKALENHEDPKVQALVAARVGLKSTLEETRTERFIDIASRGDLPVPIKYYAAHTGRWGGSDKVNLQNLPSRGSNAKVLKSCIQPPEGYTLVEADSAQIEARVLAWLASQDNLVKAFANGDDVYKIMAAAIYGKPIDEIDKDERFVGKTTILGAGYGMGSVKFRDQLKGFGVEVSEEEAKRIIGVYRNANSAITNLWREAGNALMNIYQGLSSPLGKAGVLKVEPSEKGIRLPSGLLMYYADLKAEETERGVQFSYQTRRGRTKIYGGKVIENVCQGIARCIMADQMARISKKYRVLLTVHDSVICCVEDSEVDEAATFVNECMRWTPEWANTLPVRGDVEVGKNYGECVEWKPSQHGRSAV